MNNICQEKLITSQFIFNADESGFHTDPSRLKAIGEKGKTLSRVTGGSGRESISVLACISADGLYLQPLSFLRVFQCKLDGSLKNLFQVSNYKFL